MQLDNALIENRIDGPLDMNIELTALATSLNESEDVSLVLGVLEDDDEFYEVRLTGNKIDKERAKELEESAS